MCKAYDFEFFIAVSISAPKTLDVSSRCANESQEHIH